MVKMVYEEKEKPTNIHEILKQEAFIKNYNENAKAAESAERYICSLLGFKDSKVKGHGIDCIDNKFDPPIYFEVKTSFENVVIPDTEFYHINSHPYYLVAVKRVDNLVRYTKERRGKNKKLRKVMKKISQKDSLLLDFGGVYIIDFKNIVEHYIAQRTKNLVEKNLDKVGKIYNSRENLETVMSKKSRKDLESIIERKENGESISHEERTKVSLTFSQAAQIIFKHGDHHRLLIRRKKFNQDYDFKVLEAPSYGDNKKSKVFAMSYDQDFLKEIENRLTKNNKFRIKKSILLKKEG